MKSVCRQSRRRLRQAYRHAVALNHTFLSRLIALERVDYSCGVLTKKSAISAQRNALSRKKGKYSNIKGPNAGRK
ncbi:hypothetical protein Pelo_2651 [Pelomyxa schiedti]|nr:hypothetical protein Pelo_2651 [Pelomyxa schiedti]